MTGVCQSLNLNLILFVLYLLAKATAIVVKGSAFHDSCHTLCYNWCRTPYTVSDCYSIAFKQLLLQRLQCCAAGVCSAERRLLSVPKEWQVKAWGLGESLHHWSKGRLQALDRQLTPDFHEGTALPMTITAGQLCPFCGLACAVSQCKLL